MINNDIVNIGQVLEGNVNAFSNIVNRYKDKTFNLAFRICGNREEAEEIAQDAFLKAYRGLKGFKQNSSFSTWLYRIVYNSAISHIRQKKNRILSIEDFPAEAKDFTGENTTDEEAEKEYRNSLVNFALQKINEDDRALVTLYYYDELSTDEISEVTGIGKSNVKVRLFRARQRMQEVIERVELKKSIYHG